MLSRYLKEKITEELLLDDEPKEGNLDFNFDKYAEQIFDILKSEDMIKPLTIGIHGEWGSGKTSLMKRVCEKLKEQTNYKSIWFNAWKYEKIGITSSLLQKITKEIKGNEYFKKNIEFFGSIAFDITFQKLTAVNFTDLQKRHKEIFNNVDEQFHENIKKIIGKERVVIFVDELDRCRTDNILTILESIKLFMLVDNITFVIAADMSKIERAWTLKYNSKEGHAEGIEYVEKFFQLKLNIPPKSSEELRSYIKKLVKILDEENIEWLIKNSPPNPRKIKRMLNLLYFALKNFDGEDMYENNIACDFDEYFKILTIWIAISLHHPTIIKNIKSSVSLFNVAQSCFLTQSLSVLKDEFERNENSKKNKTKENQTIIDQPTSNLTSGFDPMEYEIIKYVVNDDNNAYEILKHLGDTLINSDNQNKIQRNCDLLEYIITNTKMIS